MVKEPVAGVVAPTVPLMLMEAVPVKPVAAPVNEVELKTPVLGLNCSLVDDTFAVLMLPVEAVVKVGKKDELVVVSSTIVKPPALSCQVGAEAPFEVTT